MKAVLRVGPDGTVCGLYTEMIDLAALGYLTVRRATTIEFDNIMQDWLVCDLEGRVLYSASYRQQCLDWEAEHLVTPEAIAAMP